MLEGYDQTPGSTPRAAHTGRCPDSREAEAAAGPTVGLAPLPGQSRPTRPAAPCHPPTRPTLTKSPPARGAAARSNSPEKLEHKVVF